MIGVKYIFEIVQNAAREAVRAYFRPLTVAAAYIRSACVIEKLMAALCLVSALPLIIIAAIAVKLSSSGPPFYSQTRVGYKGRAFKIYKLRTMHHDAETGSGVRWSCRGDRRITRIGILLRKTHIDELPQLINVLKGDMALIGPRPERPELLFPLSQAISGYSNRLASRPGITGLAQVHLPPDSTIESVRIRFMHDIYYLANRSLLLDIRILLASLLQQIGVSFLTLLILPPRSEIESHPLKLATKSVFLDFRILLATSFQRIGSMLIGLLMLPSRREIESRPLTLAKKSVNYPLSPNSYTEFDDVTRAELKQLADYPNVPDREKRLNQVLRFADAYGH